MPSKSAGVVGILDVDFLVEFCSHVSIVVKSSSQWDESTLSLALLLLWTRCRRPRRRLVNDSRTSERRRSSSSQLSVSASHSQSATRSLQGWSKSKTTKASKGKARHAATHRHSDRPVKHSCMQCCRRRAHAGPGQEASNQTRHNRITEQGNG